MRKTRVRGWVTRPKLSAEEWVGWAKCRHGPADFLCSRWIRLDSHKLWWLSQKEMLHSLLDLENFLISLKIFALCGHISPACRPALCLSQITCEAKEINRPKSHCHTPSQLKIRRERSQESFFILCLCLLDFFFSSICSVQKHLLLLKWNICENYLVFSSYSSL